MPLGTTLAACTVTKKSQGNVVISMLRNLIQSHRIVSLWQASRFDLSMH